MGRKKKIKIGFKFTLEDGIERTVIDYDDDGIGYCIQYFVDIDFPNGEHYFESKTEIYDKIINLEN